MGNTRTLNIALWTVQVLLALFFAGASGAPKFFLPDELLAMPIVLPRAFLVVIGTAEVLGALGLIVPGMTRIRPGLTPLAAACLVALTICAAVYQLLGHQPANAVFALVIGAVALFVAYGRWKLAPLGGSSRHAPRIQAATVVAS
jgi:putative oxidoreductase